jgi:hypothetical protein
MGSSAFAPRCYLSKGPPRLIHARLVAAAIGYFRFGFENPALLNLMFETKGLDEQDPCLRGRPKRS